MNKTAYEGVNIFLSSTFDAGMKENRDLFRNEISARLNHMFGEIGYNAYIYDLELGVPEGTSSYNTLKICYDRIKRSDFFLCILGFNYGSLVSELGDFQSIETEIADKEYGDKIIKYLIDEISITESEIRFVNEFKDKEVSFFIHNDIYQMKEEEINSIKEQINIRINEVDTNTTSPAEAMTAIKEGLSEAIGTFVDNFGKAIIEKYNNQLEYSKKHKNSHIMDTKESLRLLQRNIEKAYKAKSELVIHNKKIYTYSDRKELAERVIEYFINTLSHDCRFSQIKMAGDFDKSRNLILARKTRYLNKNDAEIKKAVRKLHDYINGDDYSVMVVTGDKYAGKSSVIAAFEQEIQNNREWLVVSQYAGTIVKSAYDVIKAILMKLYEGRQDNDLLDINTEMTESALLTEFYRYIQYYLYHDIKVLIIIDGFDEIEYFEEITSAYWIPEYLPPNIKLIVSTNNSGIFNNVITMNVKPPDINMLIKSVFDLEGKDLEYPKIEERLSRVACSHPNYLITLTREIMTELNYETINKQLDKMLSECDSYEKLMDRYISRIINRFGNPTGNIALLALRDILLSKHGITIEALKYMYGSEIDDFIYMIYYDLTIDTNNMVSISNGTIRECFTQVLERNGFLKESDLIVQHRRVLEALILSCQNFDHKIDFSNRTFSIDLYSLIKSSQCNYPDNKYILDEVLYQLDKAKGYSELRMILSDVNRSGQIANNLTLLKSYLNKTDDYEALLEDWKTQTKCKLRRFVGLMYRDMGLYKQAENYHNALLKTADYKIETKGNYSYIALLNTDLATTCMKLNPSKAQKFAKKAVELLLKALGTRHIYTQNAVLVLAQAASNDYKAIKILDSCIYELERIVTKYHPAFYYAYLQLGSRHNSIGDYNKAIECFKLAEIIIKKTFGVGHNNTKALYLAMSESYLKLGDFNNMKDCEKNAQGRC